MLEGGGGGSKFPRWRLGRYENKSLLAIEGGSKKC
jgi:hypothetical protein